MKHVYLASGWFNENDDRILSEFERTLSRDDTFSVHRPRLDGIELKPGEFHNPKLRKKVFRCNVKNINAADFLVANLTTGSAPRLDTGTVWEVAYAHFSGKPVIIYNETEETEPLSSRLGNLVYGKGFIIVSTMEAFWSVFYMYLKADKEDLKYSLLALKGLKKPTIFLPIQGTETYNVIMRSCLDILPQTMGISYVTNYLTGDLTSVTASLINREFVLIPTETKDSILTYMMGVAYARKLPIITYSPTKDSINLMLICSVRAHAVGEDQLVTTLKKIVDSGVSSLKFDMSEFRVY